ncbi:MAG: hypothetical protein HY246_24040 [Proteobacteria bacterium]|nr:hypothetical protein [Pseudomonadota bacterium]
MDPARIIEALRLSLLEIFGYLVPGTMFALGILLMALAPEENRELDLVALVANLWFFWLLLAYLLGRMSQGVSLGIDEYLHRQAGKRWKKWKRLVIDTALRPHDLDDSHALVSAELADEAARRVAKKLALPEPQLQRPDRRLLRAFCEQLVAQSGKSSFREIFETGEALCRGLIIALGPVILGIATLIAVAHVTPMDSLPYFEFVCGKITFKLGSDVVPLGLWHGLLFLAAAVAGVYASWQAARRYSRLRFRTAITEALVLLAPQ